MKRFVLAISILSVVVFSCKKETTSNTPEQAVNTWSFKAQGTTYQGELYWDPLLNTMLQSNNTYTFTILGGETTSDRVFNIAMSLSDTTFTQSTYQSGIDGTDAINGFYFTHGVGGSDIYKSSNYDPGPVLNYRIESYNSSTRVLIITFSGNAQDASGVIVPITEGKVTCKVEKM